MTSWSFRCFSCFLSNQTSPHFLFHIWIFFRTFLIASPRCFLPSRRCTQAACKVDSTRYKRRSVAIIVIIVWKSECWELLQPSLLRSANDQPIQISKINDHRLKDHLLSPRCLSRSTPLILLQVSWRAMNRDITSLQRQWKWTQVLISTIFPGPSPPRRDDPMISGPLNSIPTRYITWRCFDNDCFQRWI